MQEATLEARLNAQLSRLFPTISPTKIVHQKTFTLKFGHREIIVDCKKRFRAGGRLDVLLEIAGKPSVLFELKKPGQRLTEEDRDQGISYSRLLTPMPPILIISNGTDTQFYKTIDGTAWDIASLDEKAVQTLFSQALEVAGQEKDEAVMTLLGKVPSIWMEIITKESEKNLAEISGPVGDMKYDVASEFMIKRECVTKILDLLRQGKSTIVLRGPSLSGKTNVMKQLGVEAQKAGFTPLYVDARSMSYGVIQFLATLFCRDMFYEITPDKIRQWLLSCFRGKVDQKLILMIDGWHPLIANQLSSDIAELVTLYETGSMSIVLALDDNTWEFLRHEPGRITATRIGRDAEIVDLGILNDDEFRLALEQLFTQFNATFYKGAWYNIEYRQPRLLRILAVEMAASKFQSPSKKPIHKVAVFPSITGIHILNVVWDVLMGSPELRSDFNLLARAYIEDRENREADPSLYMLSHGRGHLLNETAESILGVDRVKRLREWGYISLISGPRGHTLVLPKVVEMMSAAAANLISNEVLKRYHSDNKDEAYFFALQNSVSFPMGDIVGAKSILEASKSDETLCAFFINRLLADEPKMNQEEVLLSGLLNLPDVGEIPLNMVKVDKDELVDNLHPWLVLSHLAGIPFVSGSGSPNAYLKVLATVGSFSGIFRRPDIVGLGEVKGFLVHDITGYGTILCGGMGIYEPITHAVMIAFHNFPQDMIRLSQWTVEHDVFHLANRILTAAKATIPSTNKNASQAAKKSKEILSKYVNNTLKKAGAFHSEDA